MAEDIAVKVAEIEQRSKSNTHRLDKVEERQDNLDKLVSSVEVLATRQETVETDVKEIKTDVKALTEKPAKRWDGIVDKLIWLAVSGAVGFLAAQIGDYSPASPLCAQRISLLKRYIILIVIGIFRTGCGGGGNRAPCRPSFLLIRNRKTGVRFIKYLKIFTPNALPFSYGMR